MINTFGCCRIASSRVPIGSWLSTLQFNMGASMLSAYVSDLSQIVLGYREARFNARLFINDVCEGKLESLRT